MIIGGRAFLFLGCIGYEAAGFGLQVGTKGCLAATKILPSVAKSTLTMAGFSRKGDCVSSPK
jgi:hypothetical protein